MLLLDLSGFGSVQAESFLSYNQATREIIVLLEEEPMMALLNQAIDQALVLDALSPQSISESEKQNAPANSSTPGMEQKVLEVADLLRNSGNSELYQKILDEMDDEPWTDEWIKTAKVANQLSQDYAEPDGRPDDSIK